MNDPWTWTIVCELTVGVGGEMGRGAQSGENWNNYNRITIKMILKEIKKKKTEKKPKPKKQV